MKREGRLLDMAPGEGITGREWVRFVCPRCNGTVAKAFAENGGSRVWLNTQSHPEPGRWGGYRGSSDSRLRAPEIVSVSVNPLTERNTWCERCGLVLAVPAYDLAAVIARAQSSGSIARIVSQEA